MLLETAGQVDFQEKHVNEHENNARNAERARQENGGPHKAEVNEHTPNLMEEYGDEEVDLFGFKDKLSKLPDGCPFAAQLKDGTISLGRQNDFVIRAFNQTGMSVKPEHFSYFSDRLAAMGQDVKITIREDEPEKQSWLRNDEKKDSEATKVRDEFDHARRATKDSVQSEPRIQDKDDLTVDPESLAPRVVRDTLIQDYDASEGETESLPKVREVSVEEWFDVMTVEYAEHQRRHTVESDEKPVDEIAVVSAQDEILIPAKRIKVAPKRSLKDQGLTKEAVVVPAERVSPEEEIGNTPETRVGEAEDIVQIESRVELDVAQDESRILELSVPHDISSSEVSADDHEEVSSSSAGIEDTLDELQLEVTQEDRDTNEGVGEGDFETESVDVAELPEVLEGLFVRFDNENAYTSVDIEDIQDVESTERAASLEADQEFISQIEAYITQLEAVEMTMDSAADVHVDDAEFTTQDDREKGSEEIDTYLQPRQAFVQILELTQQIQIHRAEIVVAIESEADNEVDSEQLAEMQETQEALETELYEVCEQFLESIGVEPTKEKVQALVERVLKIDFEALEKEQKFSVQQLAKMGTREYKTGSSFKRTIAHAKSSLWQVVGTFALQHISVDSIQNEMTSV